MTSPMPRPLARREFLLRSGLLVSSLACRSAGSSRSARRGSATLGSSSDRPQIAHGIQIGDACGERAIVWSRADRDARLIVEWDTSDTFANARTVRGPYALATSDYTARVDLTGLPAGEPIFLRVRFQGLNNDRAFSEPCSGHFRAAPWKRGRLRFVWGGDTAGQGFGINPDFGGMRIYETMRLREPDFFLHSGDTIYADAPIEAEKMVEDGKLWRNLVTEEKSKVAETLAEFRGAYRYNLRDENVRRFNAEVPQIWQWDDHEVVNNWSDSKDLTAHGAYTEKGVPLLVARASRAFLEYAPLRPAGADESERVYRHIPHGPLLDMFVIDMRSYRGPNTYNRQPEPGPDTAFLGGTQLAWLQDGLLNSRATWKVIAADMPLGLLVDDGKDREGRRRFEGVANGEGAALGRELEFARLLKFIKDKTIRNVVWLTADVHYTAAHYYDPAKAKFTDFDGFWEFVAGPLNAGSFGPAVADDTFGMQVVFQKYPPEQNSSPLAGYQFFGQVEIGEDRAMTVALIDIDGTTVFEKTLSPV
jgi:alkaline phosphatase D